MARDEKARGATGDGSGCTLWRPRRPASNSGPGAALPGRLRGRPRSGIEEYIMGIRARLVPVLSLAVAVLVAACSSSASSPSSGVLGATSGTGLKIGTGSSSLGQFLTGQGGMTLYVFTKDTQGTSNCTGNCAATWPPLTIATGENVSGPAGAPGKFGTISRQSGQTQVTYDGMPLYYYSGDSNPGETNGQGVGNVWFVALVSGSVGASPTSGPPTLAPPTSMESGGGAIPSTTDSSSYSY
jgi:predicted lipoprotein with Yx(FWY)xxD motif